ncbi:hypothetical protein AOC36_01050 [Erysipelothrix larvae]|uniref:Two-component system response regulator n=1 Tax=Erysipelothrix larvae TaxID=1514105 RepID=A0A0X8GY92_9FIRM|nr:response regulator transcription factor [Erysipelothrix larvae]AMC92629.1 hypothetical protein AOC36_01050 [Erysipelothrix larvae]
MKKKILIVDDEPNIRVMVQKYGAVYDFDISGVGSGVEALEYLKNNPCDCVIMDVMMPHMDGYTAVTHLREFSDVPVLMLTAKSELEDRLTGLQLGIDDYVVKPFSLKELMLRIQAILNRASHLEEDLYIYKGLVLNNTRRDLTLDGELVELSSKEFNLLLYLIKHRGHSATRNGCIDNVWGEDFNGDVRTLDTHIKVLRQKLKQYGMCIITERGVGYRFEEI